MHPFLLSLAPAIMERWCVEQHPALVSVVQCSLIKYANMFTQCSSVLPWTAATQTIKRDCQPVSLSLCLSFSVDCGWSSWTQWSACSRTCDVGVRRRYRSGTNPPAAFGGRVCRGDRVGMDTCSLEPCQGRGGDRQTPSLHSYNRLVHFIGFYRWSLITI